MKRWIKKLFIVFVVLFSFTLTNSEVFGYNLKFKAKFKDDGTYSCTIRSITQGSENSRDNYIAATGDTTGKTWVYNSTENPKAGKGGQGYYSTYAIRFALNVTSEYNDGFITTQQTPPSSYNAYYDRLGNNNVIDLNTYDWNKYTNPGVATSVKGSIAPIKMYEKDVGYDFYQERYRVEDPKGKRINVADWYLSNGLINDLIGKYTSETCTNGNLRFTWLPRSDDNRFVGATRDDENAVRMQTAHEYFQNTVGKWNSGSRGFPRDLSVSPNGTAAYNMGSSAINQFDNILIIPLGDLTPRKVYVRHVDKDGNLLNIANSSQVLVESDGGYSIKGNAGAKDGYQEYYEFRINQNMQISKSTQLAVNGMQYSYLDVKYAVGSNLDDANRKFKNSTNRTNNTMVSTKSTNKADVMVVEFRYNQTDVNETDPKIKLEEKETETCEIYKAPIGSNVTPFTVANKYIPTDIKYSLEIRNGRPVYVLSEFKVNKLASFTVEDISGTDKSKLLNVGSRNVTVSPNNFDSELMQFKNIYDNKSLDQIPKSVTSGANTNKKDFTNNSYTIPMDKYNGIRELYGYVSYNKVNVLNGNIESYNSKVINNLEVNPKINVYAPLTVDFKTETGQVVDHTSGTSGFVVQRDAEITITPQTLNNTDKYLAYYYVLLDFDAQKLPNSGNIKAGTPVRVEKGGTLKIKATSGSNEGDIIAQISNKIKVIGVTVNMPDNTLLRYVLEIEGVTSSSGFVNDNNEQYVDKGTIKVPEATCEIDEDDYNDRRHRVYINGGMFRDAYYFVKVIKSSKNVGRIYDFKVTDCTDINFKNVFRITSGNTVNSLTGNTYISGDKKLYIYQGQNILLPVSNLGITGTQAKKILPLGPYKNTNPSYVQAPKMGYRISFDLKTSGYYAYNKQEEKSSRKIVITPSYYYLSKDGTRRIDNITLYYKDSSGKYVNFKNSNYTIYFKPNDGYRFRYNSEEAGNTKWMSTQLEPLTIGKDSFELNYKMMTSSGNDFIQAWYGEFKLPNSTIAVGGGASVNNPLTNGYVGVKFDIKCVDTNGVTVSYNELDKGTNSKPNTTQWDYEGYMSYNGAGRVLAADDGIKLQLEKGVYQIDTQVKYDAFKSTVVLFDLDNRAANDFE